MHPRQDRSEAGENFTGTPVVGRRVDECASLGDLLEHCLPAFGGAYLRRVYLILREAISKKYPLVISIAGPVTLSDQHRAWLIPLLETGWVAYIATTDAVCYHDGHDCLREFSERPMRSVDIFGDDGAYRDAGIIRVADIGFHENILYDQDRMISAIFQRPEFQKPMTTTERNFLLGKQYAEAEAHTKCRPGLLSTCHKFGVPVFVGAAGDGSAALNAAKLWTTLARLDGRSYRHAIDIPQDILEACAYHLWALRESDARGLAALILGGGVPKNYILQPEPALSQIFCLTNIRGYDYDVQIVSSPVTDGSLSSCFPSEAVTWGKIFPDTYRQTTASLQTDYSMVMPFIVRALLEDGTLERRPQLRLYEERVELVDALLGEIITNRAKIEETLTFTPRETNPF